MELESQSLPPTYSVQNNSNTQPMSLNPVLLDGPRSVKTFKRREVKTCIFIACKPQTTIHIFDKKRYHYELHTHGKYAYCINTGLNTKVDLIKY